ncbi:MAG: TIGR04255 family protein [Bacteroidota bacterium]
MSKLLNAPLLEVIFEVRWQLNSNEDLTKCQYLHGDLFAKIGDKYPYREMLIPPEVPIDLYKNVPAHRFRVRKNSYPLIQVGPGILTVNTIDDKYIWEDYKNWCSEAFMNLIELYKFGESEHVTLSLKYFDFFPFNFKNEDVNKYLSEFFHIKLNQSFIKESGNPSSVNLGFFYNTKFGDFSIRIIRGNNSKRQSGIIFDTTLSSQHNIPDLVIFSKWLNNAHDYVSNTFKEMTKGKMYDSFK